MFSKFTVFATLSLALSAMAGSSKCNTGEIQCCNSLHTSKQAGAAELMALVGATVQGATGQIGVNCSPISAVGVGGGSSCSQQPVCCEDNKYNGLIAFGCNPVNVAL